MKFEDNRKESNVIVVVGATSSSGATHFCFLLANYYAAKERKRVAYMEVSDETHLGTMFSRQLLLDKHLIEKTVNFEYGDIAIYPCSSIEKVHLMNNENYDVVIVDAKKWDISLNSYKTFVVGSIQPWKYSEYETFIKDKMIEGPMQGTCLCVLSGEKDRLKFVQEFSLDLQEIPFVANPFCISYKEIEALEKILGVNSRKKKRYFCNF